MSELGRDGREDGPQGDEAMPNSRELVRKLLRRVRPTAAAPAPPAPAPAVPVPPPDRPERPDRVARPSPGSRDLRAVSEVAGPCRSRFRGRPAPCARQASAPPPPTGAAGRQQDRGAQGGDRAPEQCVNQRSGHAVRFTGSAPTLLNGAPPGQRRRLRRSRPAGPPGRPIRPRTHRTTWSSVRSFREPVTAAPPTRPSRNW